MGWKICWAANLKQTYLFIHPDHFQYKYAFSLFGQSEFYLRDLSDVGGLQVLPTYK